MIRINSFPRITEDVRGYIYKKAKRGIHKPTKEYQVIITEGNYGLKDYGADIRHIILTLEEAIAVRDWLIKHLKTGG